MYPSELYRAIDYQNWPSDLKALGLPTKVHNLSEDIVKNLLSDEMIASDFSQDSLDPFKAFLSHLFDPKNIFITRAKFLKTNWSAGTDSAQLLAGGTKLLNAEDAYTMLKSSDKIMHDLTDPFFSDHQGYFEGYNFTLLERPWIDIPHSAEYRLFVYEGKLIAITQRYNVNAVDNIADTGSRLINYFQNKLLPNLPEIVKTTVIDVAVLIECPSYVSINKILTDNYGVVLMDLAPFDPVLGYPLFHPMRVRKAAFEITGTYSDPFGKNYETDKVSWELDMKVYRELRIPVTGANYEAILRYITPEILQDVPVPAAEHESFTTNCPYEITAGIITGGFDEVMRSLREATAAQKK